MDHNKEVMTPTEFVLWLNGATSMVDGPPSAEQWAKMQENLHPIIAKMMADKLMGSAEEVMRRKAQEAEIAVLKAKLAAEKQQIMDMITRHTGTYTYAPDWSNHPLGQNVHRSGQISLHTGGVSVAPLNTSWLSNVPPG